MKRIEFSSEKNSQLKDERGYCFDDIVDEIINKRYKIKKNRSSNHLDQKVFELILNGYPVIVPFVEDDEKIFLKTMYKSRKLKKELENEKK